MICNEVHNVPGGNLNVRKTKAEALLVPITAFGLVIIAEKTKHIYRVYTKEWCSFKS